MGGTFPGRAGVPKAGHFPTTSHRMPMNGMATSKSENATLNSARSVGAPFATCYYMKPNMASGTRATPRTCLARPAPRSGRSTGPQMPVAYHLGLECIYIPGRVRIAGAAPSKNPSPLEPIPIVLPWSVAKTNIPPRGSPQISEIRVIYPSCARTTPARVRGT